MSFDPSGYCDSSFLLSTYLVRENTPIALETLFSLKDPVIRVSPMLRLEVENAIRLAAFLLSKGNELGIRRQVAESALARLEFDFDEGRLELLRVDHAEVIACAMEISNARTWQIGGRTMDIYHVATARVLGARQLFSFDSNQRSGGG